ncbi:MAG: MCE family protein [Deltaproteobacteria bacterium]|nr:MAG: MCE family protein [Deltaproteobacteria bacterium]
MINRAQRIRLGIFVIVALGLFLALIVSVVGSSLLEKRDHYLVRYDISVSGLEVGAPVKYNGVRVGRVESIRIDPEQVSRSLVEISLQRGTPVKKNARAILSVQGITGLKFIELVGGTSDADSLEPGSEIPAGKSVVDKLTGKAETLALKTEMLVNQLLALTGKENQALVTDVLEHSGELAGTLNELVQRNNNQLDRLIASSSLAAKRLADVLDEMRQLLRASRESVLAVRRAAEKVLDSRKIGALLDDGRQVMGELKKRAGGRELGKVLQVLGRLAERTDRLVDKLDVLVNRSKEDIRASLRYLAETAENFRDFSRIIREDPSLLLRQRERRERVLP